MHNSRITTFPRPALGDLSARADLSAARRRVLEVVEASDESMTAVQVASALNLHHNTVREHLDSLVDAGFVTISTRPTGKRGRPALRYSSTAPDPRQVIDSYLLLLDAVAHTLGKGESAQSAALEIGRRWAELTPAVAQIVAITPAGSRERIMSLLPYLAMMGFAPEVKGEDVILRSCPLVTHGHTPDPLVCAMHEGFVRSAAETGRERVTQDGPEPAPLRIARSAGEGCQLQLHEVTSTAKAS
ncbi:metalloregulator ArsR/SmtB family transcription factor [Actinomyces slackii]|uniref:Predicted transcriptional regulator n=1 Tax=Actinomyces slackii TaxID=52774 RepID=A0A448KFX3_9ACTO|nr:helix-turn-helix domain-containing protein [Actinomyces slackii]VEG75792.1 Predicted transcriptional regulator [Actinomyces slackii]